MMAGNVFANLGADGLLRINRDENSNGVGIVQTGINAFRVTGLIQGGSTSINKWGNFRDFHNVTAVVVDLGGGMIVLKLDHHAWP